MKLNGVHLLEKNVKEFGNLKDEEKSEIIDFCMLWSFVEGEYLNEHATVNTIGTFVKNLERDGELSKLKLDKHVQYFRNRYFLNRKFTAFYRTLYLERSASSPQVSLKLREDGFTASQRLIGCLVIIYRFISNLFHGVNGNITIMNN